MLLAFAIGALGNLVGTAITGTALVWDASLTDCLHIVLGHVLSLLIGFTLGVLIRTSSGAIVAYFVYSFLLPAVFGLLAASQDWFRDPAALDRRPVRPEHPLPLRGFPDR